MNAHASPGIRCEAKVKSSLVLQLGFICSIRREFELSRNLRLNRLNYFSYIGQPYFQRLAHTSLYDVVPHAGWLDRYAVRPR